MHWFEEILFYFIKVNNDSQFTLPKYRNQKPKILTTHKMVRSVLESNERKYLIFVDFPPPTL